MLQELSIVVSENYLILSETNLKIVFESCVLQFPIYCVHWVHVLQSQRLHCFDINGKQYDTNHLACTSSSGNQYRSVGTSQWIVLVFDI